MRFFTRDEFVCNCGCKKNEIKDEFLQRLDKARLVADVPFVIVSGYRCPAHNKKIGSTSTNHTRGLAADIQATDGTTRGKILRGLYRTGFERVGISFERGFVHADINDGPPSCWSYPGG